eukprot:TRINITY_DN1216_c0_g1_i9.p3 TRINITY_DN1216_c0_g1~~TRINITY_DN1216_c0_g1_i9.p3  ORF type:complete len:119 (-),score=9.43 TRINITY_DN1216_c0_g1_i9:301-657(-)
MCQALCYLYFLPKKNQTLVVPRTAEAKNQLDNWWLDLLLCIIGEQFENGDDICGVSANVRQRSDRITMWTKTAANEAAQVGLGKQLRSMLDLPEGITLGYIFHDDVKRDQKAKDRYTV